MRDVYRHRGGKVYEIVADVCMFFVFFFWGGVDMCEGCISLGDHEREGEGERSECGTIRDDSVRLTLLFGL